MHAVGHVVQASIAGLRCSHQRRNDKLRQLHYAIASVHKGVNSRAFDLARCYSGAHAPAIGN